MSSQTIREHGFPLGQIKGNDYFYFSGSEGGKGGGDPSVPLTTVRYLYWPIKINPFSVKNKKCVILNTEFKSYVDATIVGEAIVPGQSLGFSVLLAYHPPISDSISDASITGTIQIPSDAMWPMELIFEEKNIPQPIVAGYERRIWVIIDLGKAGVFIGQDTEPTRQRMNTQVLDFEERI